MFSLGTVVCCTQFDTCHMEMCGGGISYRTTRTEAFILDCISKLCSKLMRTMFFWNHKIKNKKKHTVPAILEASHSTSGRGKKVKMMSWCSSAVTYQINTKVPGELKTCKRTHYICSIRGNRETVRRTNSFFSPKRSMHNKHQRSEEEDKGAPPSTWTRPRSKRMCTDCSDRVGFTAESLKEIKTLF